LFALAAASSDRNCRMNNPGSGPLYTVDIWMSVQKWRLGSGLATSEEKYTEAVTVLISTERPAF
jgi:hypothetical protein